MRPIHFSSFYSFTPPKNIVIEDGSASDWTVRLIHAAHQKDIAMGDFSTRKNGYALFSIQKQKAYVATGAKHSKTLGEWEGQGISVKVGKLLDSFDRLPWPN